MNRDRWELKLDAAGKHVPYGRTPQQIADAKANVQKNAAPAPEAKGAGTKGKGKKGDGKGKGKIKWGSVPDGQCGYFLGPDKKCPHGERCWYRAKTPGHP